MACDDLTEGQSCTLIGCSDVFNVTALATQELPLGRYELRLLLGDVPVTCEHPPAVGVPRISGYCDDARVRSEVLIHNGGAPAADGGAPGGANAFGIRISDTVSVIALQVLYEGQEIGAASYTPVYQTTTPNGPECGPVCRFAPWEQLSLQFE